MSCSDAFRDKRERDVCLLVRIWVSTIPFMGRDGRQNNHSLAFFFSPCTLSDCAVCSEGFGRGAGNECHECTGYFKGVMYFLLTLATLVTFLLMTLLAIFLVRRSSETEIGGIALVLKVGIEELHCYGLTHISSTLLR